MKLNPIGSNMTEIRLSTKTILFSYKTPVAMYDSDNVTWYKTNKYWSATTSRHINKWLKQWGGVNIVPREMDQAFFDAMVP